MNFISSIALAASAPDDGGPGYVVAAVIAAAVLLLVYLAIVALRVRKASNTLAELEQRLAAGEQALQSKAKESEEVA